MSAGDPDLSAASGSHQDISNLQETFIKQQAQISALKELVRKSESTHGKSTSSAQEKVKNIAQRLSHIKSKARSRQNLDSSLSELKDETILEETPVSSPAPKARSETPGSEKIQMLRRQVEESKIKMAAREHNKREIEERVTQLKAKFDSTQQCLERSSELGRSMGDLSILTPGSTKEKFKSATDLSFTPLNLDKEKIKFLENRIKLLEKQIEKQSVETQCSSEAELVTTLRHKILDLEENLREKECIIEARTQAVSLMSESLSAKTATTVDTLEDTRLEMQRMQQHFIDEENALKDEINKLHEGIEEKNQRIRNLEEVNDILESARFELTVKNAELESKLEDVQEYSTKLDELNKFNEALQQKVNNLEEQLAEKTVECNVLNANFSVLQEKLKSTAPKSLFSKTGDEEVEQEIKKLKDQLDEANKSMIKVKLKAKQLQKQVDKFKKMSDVNSEVIRLTDENQELQMKIAELEEEKGSMQLKLLNREGDTERISDNEMQKKIQVLETTCQNQTSAIQLLEEQKLELHTSNQELEAFRERIQKAGGYQSEELQADIQPADENNITSEIDQLKKDLDKQKTENDSLREEILTVEEEKIELQKKVNHYIAENMELLDKVEKLSKSSSSAESIEIVERLTHQEKLEMEEFNKNVPQGQEELSKSKTDESTNSVMGQELSDSLVKLREESSELMHRIELFTKERREVLAKMELLTSENQDLTNQIKGLNEEKSIIEDYLTKSKLEIVSIEEKLDLAIRDSANLQEQLRETQELKGELEEEIKALRFAKETAVLSSKKTACPQLLEQCTESLAQMQSELENYRKSNDKSTRLSASKKLAKEAKNVSQQFNDLLAELRGNESSDSNLEKRMSTHGLESKREEIESIVSQLKNDIAISAKKLEQRDEENLQLKKELNFALENADNAKHLTQVEIAKLEQFRTDLEFKLNSAESEISILKTLVAEQKQQLIDAYTEHEIELNGKIAEIEKYEDQFSNLQQELRSLRDENTTSNENYVKELKTEIKRLENVLSSNEKLIAEQLDELKNKQDTIESLNVQIMDLYKTMEENSSKIIEKEDEISYIQELLESNKRENEALAKECEENKVVVEKLLLELHASKSSAEHSEIIASLKSENKQLQMKIELSEKSYRELDAKNKEHIDKLKKFAANLKKKTAQCFELETKLKELSSQTQTSHDNEAAEKLDYERVINALQQEIQQYKMQVQSSQTSSIQNDVLSDEIAALRIEHDLSVKNGQALSLDNEKLQFEVNQYQVQVEVFQRNFNEIRNLVDRLQCELDEKDGKINGLETAIEMKQGELCQNIEKLNTVSEELKNKNLKFEKSKAVIKEKNREIQRLTAEAEELRKKAEECVPQVHTDDSSELTQLREEYQKLMHTYESEKESFQKTISRLEILYDGIQAKFQENMGYIESLEIENNTYKEKIIKLENCIAAFEDRRQSLQKRTDMLDARLQKQSDEYERNEDALIYRLNMLLDHDDTIGKRLIDAQEEKDELLEKLQQSKQEHYEMQSKLNKAEKELETLMNEKLNKLTAENESLQSQLNVAQSELTRQQNIYEGRVSQKHAEIDDLENEWSVQLNNLNQEKRKLVESLEKSQDEINELKDENVRLKEGSNSLEQMKNDLEREMTWIRMQNDNMTQDQYELQELRMQAMQDKTEIENLKHQLDALIQNHEIELKGLREQMQELDSVRMQVGQNQTDDQVFIENENKRLKDQLAEKELAIVNYQRENLKLQMASMASGSQIPSEPFSGDTQVDIANTSEASVDEVTSLKDKIKTLENEIMQLQAQLSERSRLNESISSEVQSLREQLTKSQKESSRLRAELQKSRPLQQSFPDMPAPLNPFFSTAAEPSSVFDELVTSHNVGNLGQTPDQPDQKKIEDLERNVSDLEKHANDLESKLKNLTSVHENTLLQLQEYIQRYEATVKQYEIRIREFEEKQKELEIQKSVESMIVTENPKADVEPSLNLFFSNVPQEPSFEFDRLIQVPSSHEADETNRLPVQEETIVPKKAYLLHPEASEDPGADNEAGWGWGSEEAMLEERHQQEIMHSKSTENAKLAEYQNRIDLLELERSRSDEKMIELQVKCGKLMKKLKEYKARIDQAESERVFRKSTSVESNDLDLAIQEELKIQVAKLEEAIAEMKKQHHKELAERDGLVKRIDVLTAANERMTEMKERQDIEVESLQMKVRQLSQQLKQLEDWGDRDEVKAQSIENNEFSTTSSNQQSQIETKLRNTLKELEDVQIDRDELQALLEDERNNVVIGESKIKELKDKITSIESASCNVDQDRIAQMEETVQQQQVLLAQKEAELSNANLMNQNFQFQLNDYQATISQLSSESDSIRSQLERLQSKYSEKVNANSQLSEDLKGWMSKCETFAKEIDALRVGSESPPEIMQTNKVLEERLQELTSKLQYKEAETLHLKQRIQDLMQEDQTQSLVQEILGKNQEIVQLRMQVQQLESDKVELENNLSKQITEVMAQKPEEKTDKLEEKVISLQSKLDVVVEEKQQMEVELQMLNNHVLESVSNEDRLKEMVLEMDIKNLEIVELKRTIETLKQNARTTSAELRSGEQVSDPEFDARLAEVNRSWEQTVEQKCSEIAESWRVYMEQRESEFQETEKNLNLQIEQLRAGIVVPKRKTSVDMELEKDETLNQDTIKKMQEALEQQELEIVTLKEQLAMRSAEYARLAARHDPYAMSTSSNLSFEPNRQRIPSTSSSGAATSGEQAGVVPKSELDLALYMLHQRDMRCEELTLELVNLLEERDTLQLKLSNSLRQIEDIREKTSYPESGSDSEQALSNTNSPEKSIKLKQATVSERNLQSDNLNSKLSQLQSVGYAKDKRLREEREQRQRQMERIHQDVANIPSEAVSELVGTDLSTVQSPSNALLDWLWGKGSGTQQS